MRKEKSVYEWKEEGKKLSRQSTSPDSPLRKHERGGLGLTLDIPRPPLTPNPRRSHHIAAPAIPAAPVPLAQAPRADLDDARVGSVVDNCKKVSSPRPEESEAREIPNRRA